MNKLKETLIERARDRYEEISPCPSKGSFEECFTLENNRLCFWFNTKDQSTHVLAERVG
jgi:hypothetical protein